MENIDLSKQILNVLKSTTDENLRTEISKLIESEKDDSPRLVRAVAEFIIENRPDEINAAMLCSQADTKGITDWTHTEVEEALAYLLGMGWLAGSVLGKGDRARQIYKRNYALLDLYDMSTSPFVRLIELLAISGNKYFYDPGIDFFIGLDQAAGEAMEAIEQAVELNLIHPLGKGRYKIGENTIAIREAHRSGSNWRKRVTEILLREWMDSSVFQ